MKPLTRGILYVIVGAIPLFQLWPHFFGDRQYPLALAGIVLAAIAASIYILCDGVRKIIIGLWVISEAKMAEAGKSRVTLSIGNRTAEEASTQLFNAVAHLREDRKFYDDDSMELLYELCNQLSEQKNRL